MRTIFSLQSHRVLVKIIPNLKSNFATGSMAGYVPTPKKTLISCGGYNLKNSTYVGFCQKFLEDGKPWKAGPDLQTARAWGSAFSIGGGLATQGLYVAGGYSATEGFIDSGINQTDSIRLGVTLSAQGVILVLMKAL